MLASYRRVRDNFRQGRIAKAAAVPPGRGFEERR